MVWERPRLSYQFPTHDLDRVSRTLPVPPHSEQQDGNRVVAKLSRYVQILDFCLLLYTPYTRSQEEGIEKNLPAHKSQWWIASCLRSAPTACPKVPGNFGHPLVLYRMLSCFSHSLSRTWMLYFCRQDFGCHTLSQRVIGLIFPRTQLPRAGKKKKSAEAEYRSPLELSSECAVSGEASAWTYHCL